MFDIVKKTGSDSIFDIIFLCYRKKTKNILEDFNNETKNLLYFYNNVFIPLEVDIYKNNTIKNSNKKSLVPINSKLNKKNYDIRNLLICKKLFISKCFSFLYCC